MKNKYLRVFVKKIKFMFISQNMDTLICFDWLGLMVGMVGQDSITAWTNVAVEFCGRSKDDESYWCERCSSLARPIGGCPCDFSKFGKHTVELVDSFCFWFILIHFALINASGVCTYCVIGRARFTWRKLRELVSCLINQYIHMKTWGKIFDTFVYFVMFCGSEY